MRPISKIAPGWRDYTPLDRDILVRLISDNTSE